MTKSRVDHDHNFKNVFTDFSFETLVAFGGREGENLPKGAVIKPWRQQMQKDRLGASFSELDVPLEVIYPSGERLRTIFMLEEESDPRTLTLHRYARYAILLSEQTGTTRVVPIIIAPFAGFPGGNSLRLETERGSYLTFSPIICNLREWKASDYADSNNIVLQLCRLLMYSGDVKRDDLVTDVVRNAGKLLDDEKFKKYVEFIYDYSGLEDRKMEEIANRKDLQPDLRDKFGLATEGLMKRGRAEGLVLGRAEGKAEYILRLRLRGVLNIDQARAEFADLVASGEISQSLANDYLQKIK